LKTAIVHDWLTSPGGAECVLEQMITLYPAGDLFSVCDFLDATHRSFLRGKSPKTTFIQHLPFASRYYRSYLPLMPLAIEQFDLTSYDLIISSSYAVAKGVITGPEQLHISYVHTPVRYAWHMQYQYLHDNNLENGIKSLLARALLHYLRTWDLSSAAGVDVFLANSEYVAQQIRRLYGRDCDVLYPPVNVEELPFSAHKQEFFMTASRLVSYKRIELIVKAFAQMPTRRLVVVGDGPEREQVEKAALGHKNIEVLGYQAKDKLHELMSQAKAFVFAAIEDFGITPVEAQACGTPVIALGRGGVLESIRPLESQVPTGVFFMEQSEAAIIAAVECFERVGSRIMPENCRKNAQRFTSERFRSGIAEIVAEQMRNRQHIFYQSTPYRSSSNVTSSVETF
jgi:glycosyltransferase involved in cell wall biosynthesis